MPLEKYKDFSLNGKDFRLGLVSALKGDWIISQLLSRKISDEAVYERVQNHILGACSIYVERDGKRIPLKLFENGRWLVSADFSDLEYDFETVHALISEGLEFNFRPFFEKLKSENPGLMSDMNL